MTVQADADVVRYARVAPGDSAGIVTVRAVAEGDSTTVHVAYDTQVLG